MRDDFTNLNIYVCAIGAGKQCRKLVLENRALNMPAMISHERGRVYTYSVSLLATGLRKKEIKDNK